MPETLTQEEAIFHAALERDAADQRSAYLDAACGNQEELRRRVEVLLRRYAEAQGPLDRPVVSGTTTTEQPCAEQPGTMIGPYKLLEQIGEGGFGVVWMAEQQQPIRRKVALKVLKPGMDTRQVVARFEAERQALALMDHPNIARVFDAGETPPAYAGGSPRPYFVMELVRGVPLTQFCDANRLTVRQRLELFVTVCQAVQHAHQKGIIHRDLKPSNVLVTLHDGTPVAKVIDFGIAKALGQSLTDKTLCTGFAQMLGTPLYMSPEQAEMSGLDVDTRSDIYSLGVMLYELLTGTTPLDQERLSGVGYDELRRLIREEEPPKPSTRLSTLGQAAATVSANRQSEPQKLSQFLRHELDWIVMKTLEKDRTRRYETASAFAADVQRYLRDEPVEACPPSAWYRFRKFARRNRVVLRTASVVVLAGLLAVAVSTGLIWRANRDLQHALERERRNAYFQRIALADREWSANNLPRMEELLAQCPSDLRGWEWHYLKRLRGKSLPAMRHDAAVLCAAVSPDGELIASGSQDGVLKLWDARTGQELRRFAFPKAGIRSLAFSPDGQRLATGDYWKSDPPLIKVWDVAALQRGEAASPLLTLQGHDQHVASLVFSPDGQRLVSTGASQQTLGEVRVWSLASGEQLCSLDGHTKVVWGAAFSLDGKNLATGSNDGTVKIWDLETRQVTRTFEGHTRGVTCVAFSPDGRRLASGSGRSEHPLGGELKVWDWRTGQEEQTLRLHGAGVWCMAWSPDGRRLVTGSAGTIKIWDAATGQEALTLRDHHDAIWAVAFSPDGQRLVSASVDQTVRIWDSRPWQDSEPGQELLTLRGHSDGVAIVTFSPDGRCLATSSRDGTGKLWDAWTGAELQTLPLGGGPLTPRRLVFSPDGKWLAAVAEGKVTLWDFAALRAGGGPSWLSTVRLKGSIRGIAFCPDGKLLAAGGGLAGRGWIWDVTADRVLHELPGHTWVISAVAFSPDGRSLASAAADGAVRVWDVATGKESACLGPRHAGLATSVAFSPDGKCLASGGRDQTVRLWKWAEDLQAWQSAHVLRDPTGRVQSVAFSPDGRHLAWGATDSTVKVWEAATDEVHTLRGHTNAVRSVAFSPDRQHPRIASASLDGTVKIWELPAEVRRSATKDAGK